MSREIDERVVEMRFDNKQFEQGAGETLSTLDKLKNALKFDDATKGMDEIEKKAGGLNMAGLGSAVEGVQQKFSALETIAVGALLNIGKKVSDLGIKMAKELTIEPVTQGFSEYELKMGSIQTIMASTGESLATVNSRLNELNTYADKTIYSFSDMTSNIGKFTNSGVSLEDSVLAIQGVSNAAAVAGANSAEASRAMYNFAQALSSGSVKLVDWKSIENANMSTQEFKQNLIDTAMAMGTLVKEGEQWVSTTTDANGNVSDAFDANMNFRDSLSANWMTTEVLIQTLKNYSTDIREMTDAEKEAYEEQLKGVGYTEEQIKAIEALGQKAFDSAQDIKTFSQLMDTLKESVGSGWAQTFEIIFGDFEEAKKLWTSVANAVEPVLSGTAELRNSVLETWKGQHGRDNLFDGIAETWNSIKNIIQPIKDAYNAIFFPSFSNYAKEQYIGTLAGRLLKITNGFQSFAKTLNETSEKIAPKIERIFKGVFAIADIAGQAISALFSFITPGTTSVIGGIADALLDGAAALGDWFVELDQMLKKTDAFNQFFKDASVFIQPVIDKIIEFKDAVASLFKTGEFKMPSIAQWFTLTDDATKKHSGPVLKLLLGLKDVLVGLFTAGTKTAPTLGRIFSALGGGLSNIGAALANIDFGTIMDLVNTGVMTWMGINLAKIVRDIQSLTGALDDMGDMIVANTVKEIAVAIAILAASLLVLSLIDSNKLLATLTVTTGLFIDLFAMLERMSDMLTLKGAVTVRVAVTALKSIAAAVLVLAVALNVIAAIDENKLTSSMIAISVLLGELTGITIILSKYGGKVKTGAASIIAFAIAIRILASAVAKFGEMEWEEIGKGLVGVGALMAELAVFAVVMKKFGKIRVTDATGIVLIAAALEILQNVTKKFGDMDTEKLVQGIEAIGVLLAELAVFAVITRYAKHMMSTALGMVLMGAALEIMVDVVNKLGNIDPDALIQGLIALAGVILEVAIAGQAMKGTIGGALSMIIMAGALEVLVNVVTKLGNLSIDTIATGLITLALALGIVLGAGALAGIVAPGLLALAAAVALLGVGITLLGVGVLALSAGLTGLAVSGVAAATSLVAMLEILTVGLINIIRDNVVAIADLVVTFITTALKALKTVVPELVDTVLSIIEEVLVSCKDHIPAIVTTLVDLVIGIIDALTEKMPDLMDSIVGLVTSFFASIGAAMKKLDIGTITDFLMGVGVVAAIMLAFAGLTAIAPAAAIGIAEFGGLILEFMAVLALLGLIDQIPGIEWLLGEGAGLLELVGKAIGGFFGAIVAGFAEGVSSSFPQIGKDLSDFMTNVTPFIEGAKQLDATMLDGVKALVEIILLLTAADILAGLASWLTGNRTSLSDFGKELAEFGPYMNKYAETVKGIDPSTVEASANAAKMLAEMAKTLPNNGGLAGLIFGENSLSEFGEELAAFGPYIAEYAESVKGLDTNAVETSVMAATMLSDMAANLPNNGGLAALIFGDNKLSDFGEELAAFGPYIQEYANSVAELNVSAVEASVAAATMLADMANTLPDNGGLSALIFGDNKLSDFGAELAAFGPGISAYAESVKDIDASKVEASASAASMLVNLANALPNTGGIVSWFTGDNDISAFGQSLSAFGSSMYQYYLSIAGINVEVMNGVIDGLNKIIDIATRTATLDTSGMENFAGSLWTMGNNGIQAFLDGFYNAASDVKLAVNTMIQAAIDQIEVWKENLDITGKNSATYYENGFYSKFDEIKKHGRLAANTLTEGIKERSEEINLTGVSTALSFVAGIQTKIDDMTLNLVGISMVNAVIAAINLKIGEFNTMGQNIGQGLANGIRSKISEVEAAARELANAAAAATAATLDINSPSRVLRKLGSFGGEGFVEGLASWAKASGEAGANLAKESVLGLSGAIDAVNDLIDDENFDPVIKPVLDLTDVTAGFGQISDMFNEAVESNTIVASATIGSVQGVNATSQNGAENSQNGNTYNFIQNNSSPKALSRSEIYRQTKNQFAQFTEAVGRA